MDGITVAGGNRAGNQLNQLNQPHGICVDDDNQCIYIADFKNNRVVEWKYNALSGQVVAGGNGEGIQPHQLRGPTDVVVDKQSDSLIICDRRNRRVVKWPRRNGTQGEIIISNVNCWGLAIDNDGSLYVSDNARNEVRRWKIGETDGILVVGGNGKGNNLNQLNNPRHLFVDQDHSVYVSDKDNYRVMKWMKDAKKGIVVAGAEDPEKNSKILSSPTGVIVDRGGNVYTADSWNPRIMCWPNGSPEGRVVVGDSVEGEQPNQFYCPRGLAFDRQGNLYVSDHLNHRVQKFETNSN